MNGQTSFLDQVKEMEREAWQMDSEQSHAYFITTPVRDGNERYYRITWAIEIKPYPNPFTFGGVWCSGGAKDKDSLQKQIDEFNRQVDRWRKHGLTKVEMKEEPEIDIAEQRRAACDYLAKTKPKRVQARLL